MRRDKDLDSTHLQSNETGRVHFEHQHTCLRNHQAAVGTPSASRPTKTMATVATHASVAVLRPCGSKSRFLTGSPSKLSREFSVKSSSLTAKSFKVKAKKGEWLPGLASPAYLDGRLAAIALLLNSTTTNCSCLTKCRNDFYI